MKKKITIVVSVFLVLMIVFAVCYFTPKKFGKGVDPLNIDHINVFDGNTGVGFTVNHSEDIQYIVENIRSKPMRKGGVSLGRMGYKFSIEYVDKNDKAIIPIFFINSENTIRKDPFFYYCDGGLCIEYLTEIENKAVNHTE